MEARLGREDEAEELVKLKEEKVGALSRRGMFGSAKTAERRDEVGSEEAVDKNRQNGKR